MVGLEVKPQAGYNPDLADDYDALLAALHLTDKWDHDKTEIQAVCECPTSTLYLGILDERAVAMASMIHPVVSLGHRTAIFEDLAVHPEYTNRGIGAHILGYLENEAISLGATRIEFHSRPSREAAHRLYKRHGFEEVTTTFFRKNL